jgi:hypothetical protein
MNKKEKHALLCQFAEFLMNLKELLGHLKKSDNPKIQELLPLIEHTFKEYYLNFDVCPECGHPIPPLPKNSRMPELEELFQKYATRYENKTGEPAPIEEPVSAISTELKEGLPPALKSLKIDNSSTGKTVDDLLADFLGRPKQEASVEEFEPPRKKKLTVSSRLAELAEKDRKPVYHGKLVSIE